MPSITDLTGFIVAHSHLAYAAAFLLALSEAVLVIEVVVPRSALVSEYLPLRRRVSSASGRCWP